MSCDVYAGGSSFRCRTRRTYDLPGIYLFIHLFIYFLFFFFFSILFVSCLFRFSLCQPIWIATIYISYIPVGIYPVRWHAIALSTLFTALQSIIISVVVL